jgi:hypothetical protein
MSKEERDIMTERYAKELEASMIRRIRKVEHSKIEFSEFYEQTY